MESMTVEQFIELLRKNTVYPDMEFEAEIDGSLADFKISHFESVGGVTRICFIES